MKARKYISPRFSAVYWTVLIHKIVLWRGWTKPEFLHRTTVCYHLLKSPRN